MKSYNDFMYMKSYMISKITYYDIQIHQTMKS